MATNSSRNGGGDSSFLVHVITRGRWFMVFASFLIMAGAGATYLFGTYSKAIKSSQGYDQTTLNLLGFCKDFGANVGVLSGLIAEVTPVWFVLLLGSVLNFGGYFMIWMAVTDKIPKPKVWQMCIYICIGANSQNFANTGSLVTCVKNFPESRGVMLGLLKGFIGLSGAIFTQLYYAIYGNDPKAIILLIGWLPAAISLIFVFSIREVKLIRQPNELKVFYQYLYISIALALFLMAMIIAQRQVTFSHKAYIASATVVCALLFLPLFVSLRQDSLLWNLKKNPVNLPNEAPEEKLQAVESESKPVESLPASSSKKEADTPKITTTTTTTTSTSSSCFGNICNKPARGEDYTILQALLSMDMLIIFVATFCGLGSSLTALDNLGQIGEALGYPNTTVSSFLSLVSIWNYFGRVFAGFVSESLLQKHKMPRPLMMTFVLLVSCVGHILIAYPMRGSLYIASIITGLTLGAQLTMLFAIISELFGLKYYSTLFNCAQLASPAGSYVLNVKLTGYLYDQEAKKQLAKIGKTYTKGVELTCLGSQCYRLSFTILSGLTFFGALTMMILVMRTRKFYKSDIYRKFREAAAANEAELTSSSAR